MNRYRIRRLARELVILSLGTTSAGCYKYIGVPLTAAPVGREVRVHLSPEGHTRLTAAVGDQLPNLSRAFDGSLVQANDQQLLVSVRLATDARVVSAGLRQRVAVPLRDVQHMELKQVDRRKMTWIAVGAGAALTAIVAHFVGGIFGGTTGTIPDPGPGEIIQAGIRLPR